MPRGVRFAVRRLGALAGALLLLPAAMVVSPIAGLAATSTRNPVVPGPNSGARSAALHTPAGRPATSAPSTAVVTCDGTFNAVASPNGSGNNYLVSTSAVNANDIWSVGNSTNPGPTDQTLAEHWDGTSWSIVATPNPGGATFSNDLNGVIAISTNDVWAVGAYATSAGANAFAMHWNGSGWNWSLLQPVVNNPFSILFAVTATSTSDVWAVGTYYSAGYLPLVYHWDGASWTPSFPTNPSPVDNELFAVSAFSSTDVWAVGENTPTFNVPQQSLAYHLSSGTWSLVTTPNVGGANAVNEIFAVNALEANHAVAVGFGNFVSGVSARQSEAWDLNTLGTSMSAPVGGNLGSGDNALLAIDRSGPQIEAVGYSRVTALAPRLALALPATWDPASHTVTWAAGPVTSANPGALNNVFYSAAALSPYAFWATGYVNNGGSDQTLSELECALKFGVTAPASSFRGAVFSVTVTAQNPNSTTASAYRGSVHFTSSDPNAVLPANYMFTAGDAGTHVFSGVVLNSNGSQTITASDTVTPFATGSVTIAVACQGVCAGPTGSPGARGAAPGPAGTAGSRTAAGQSGAVGTGPRVPRVGMATESAAGSPGLPAGAPSGLPAQVIAAPPAPAPVEVASASLRAIQPAARVTITGARVASITPQHHSSSDWAPVGVVPVVVVSIALLLLVRRRNNRRLHE